ncbi:conserved hypothetical protein [Rhodopseudomonas palustris BisB5]|uniref:Activator of Hsp90 ATPase homologue 1/2-like C-terminal domain-containing protein n=1 Tax=Rhodopseudomonas palustris (strain BisB5) TaxID=316057 RepID=Q131N8_RHOPS|nr:conserved hypothetical protein [Rhodopseudomonas palustris BisB5]
MSKPEFAYVTYIETTPETLWQALIDPEFTQRYWFGVRLTSDWKPGSSFEMRMPDGSVCGRGEVVEFDPPRRMAYTFVSTGEEYRGETPACATLTLEPHGHLVKLTVVHEGFDPGGRMLDSISTGWPAILSSLKSLLETGRPLQIPSAALETRG